MSLLTQLRLPAMSCVYNLLVFLVDNKVQLRNCLAIINAQGQLYLSSVVVLGFCFVGVENKTWLIKSQVARRLSMAR